MTPPSHAPWGVDRWAPTFLMFAGTVSPKFPEAYLRQAGNVVYPTREGYWCKLCDAPVPRGEAAEEHHAAHVRELDEWRERRLEQHREALGERGGSDVPPERRLKNRISSLRHRLRYPAKFGRARWSPEEVDRMESAMAEAEAGLRDLARTLQGGCVR